MANRKKSRPTMLDVARLSGVSYQTVSRVINHHPYVSDEARRKVQEAIDALGYRPSKAATKLRSKSSKTIAIILYGSWFHGPVQIALNVEMAARTSGFDVILTNVTETQKQVTEALHHVRDWAVDGIVTIVPAHGLPLDEIYAIDEDIPVVHVDSQPSPQLPSVTFDEAADTEQIVEHLVGLGHQHFCEISGPLSWYSASRRHQTLNQALQVYDLPEPVQVAGNWTTPGGYQATRRLLDMGRTFSAIVAANDSMALGAYRALYEAGLAVPDEISLVGYGDFPESAYYTPPLTTIQHNYIKLGAMGFEYLIQLIDDPQTPIEHRRLASRLTVRESTTFTRQRA